MNAVLKLTPTKNTERGGLIIFDLVMWADGKIVESWKVNSGQPRTQTLTHYDSPISESGDRRPIPEGVYYNGAIEGAGGKFDWVGSWGPGIGDFWADIVRVDSGFKRADFERSSFGYHWDENRSTAPGSLGCIVFETREDVNEFVKALRKYDPQYTVVDYGFKTLFPVEGLDEKPSVEEKSVVKALPPKIFMNANGASLVVRERMVLEPGTYPIGTPPGGWIMTVGQKKN